MSDWRVRDDLPHKPYRPMDHRTPYRLTDESAKRLKEKMTAFCQSLEQIIAMFPRGAEVEVSFVMKREDDKATFDAKKLTLRQLPAKSA